MARTGPVQFIDQVRAEAAQVKWPSRRETIITSTMVVVMAVIMSIFFLVSDQIISEVIHYVLNLGARA